MTYLIEGGANIATAEMVEDLWRHGRYQPCESSGCRSEMLYKADESPMACIVVEDGLIVHRCDRA